MSDNLVHAISGALGGICANIATYPLLTITIRQAVKKDNEEKKQNILNLLINTIKEGKFLDLYSGISTSLFGVAVTNGIYSYWYELVNSNLKKVSKKETLSTCETMLSGAIAGTATTISTHPIWLINTRCAAKVTLDNKEDPTKVKGISGIEMLKKIIKEEGFFSLWNGITPALILVINPIIQYTTFEKLRNIAINRKGKLTGLDYFILGAAGKLVATVVTYPYTVIKSRMQLRQGEEDTSKYNSTMDAFKKIIKNEGMNGLYKGIQSKIYQSVLAAAFLFLFKDKFYNYVLRIAMLTRPKQTRIN